MAEPGNIYDLRYTIDARFGVRCVNRKSHIVNL
jgi:hypothetical protein